MELFSLEDDDARDLFITQTPISDNGGAQLLENDGISKDFNDPLRSIVSESKFGQSYYSYISDDDVFEIPCSQVPKPTNSK